MITKISSSPVQFKRFRAYMDNGKHYDFGYSHGSTYIDHRDKKKRLNYWRRHLGNPTEKTLIENLVPSPALFSSMILWGEYDTIEKNARYLNKLWKKKHKT